MSETVYTFHSKTWVGNGMSRAKNDRLCSDIAAKKPSILVFAWWNSKCLSLCLVDVHVVVRWIKSDSFERNFLLFLQQLLQNDFQFLCSPLLESDSGRKPTSNKTCHFTVLHVNTGTIILCFKVNTSDLCQIKDLSKLLLRRPTNPILVLTFQQHV